MDLKIKNKKAIVCASSKGLGYASALALAKEGVHVTINGRSDEALTLAKQKIDSITDNSVNICKADLTLPSEQEKLFDVCPDPDILVINLGGPPKGMYHLFNREDWISSFTNNAIVNIELIKSVFPILKEKKWGRIINITSFGAKQPLPSIALSNPARAAVSTFVASIKQEFFEHNITINNLLPGRHKTDRNSDETSLRYALGNPEDFGAICAFLSSSYANFITGQNIVVDGGETLGVF